MNEIEPRPKKKKTGRIILPVLLVLLLGGAVYFFQFTKMGYLFSVPFRPGFEKLSEHVYINKAYAGDKNAALALVEEAEARDSAFYGSLGYREETYLIISDDPAFFQKVRSEGKDTVSYPFPFKTDYITLSDEYLNLDITAHEITHAELHHRLTANARKRIPTWFDEGLAVQNDYREQYSEENWIEQTDSGKTATALEDMDEPSEFYAGEAEDRRFRYMRAKHEVAGWMAEHGQAGLLELIDRLNSGEDFHAAYGK